MTTLAEALATSSARTSRPCVTSEATFSASATPAILIDAVHGRVGKRERELPAGEVGQRSEVRFVGDRRRRDARLLLEDLASHLRRVALYKQLTYKPDISFTPLARIAYGGNLIVVHPSLPVKTVKDLIEMSGKPGSELTYGSWGVGSGGHLAMEALNQHAKMKMSHVPYKGVAPMLQDLLGGHIKIAAIDIGTAGQYVQSGKLRAIAATGSKRPSMLPEVPTLVEQGVPFDTESWFAVFGPANMPAPVVAELTQALERVLKSPEAPKLVRDLGMEGDLISREAFTRQVVKDSRTWADIVQKGGIKME